MKILYRALTLQSRLWGSVKPLIPVSVLLTILAICYFNPPDEYQFPLLLFSIILPPLLLVPGLGILTIYANKSKELMIKHQNLKREQTINGPFHLTAWWNYIFFDGDRKSYFPEMGDYGNGQGKSSTSCINLVFTGENGQQISLVKQLSIFQEYTYELPYSISQIPEKEIIILFRVNRLMKRIEKWKKEGFLL